MQNSYHVHPIREGKPRGIGCMNCLRLDTGTNDYYSCDICPFTICEKCYKKLTNVPKNKHHHRLLLANRTYVCDTCQKNYFGVSMYCNTCKFNICENCCAKVL